MQANQGETTQTGRLRNLQWFCDYTGFSKNAAYHLVSRGKVPVTRIDGRLRFDIVAIDKWININTTIPERAA